MPYPSSPWLLEGGYARAAKLRNGSMDKKPLVFETVRSVTFADEYDDEKQNVRDPNWKPGFRARFPWIGFAALVTILICCASSVVILESANGMSQTDWPKKIAPNVLLNIMNNIANICFGIAIGNGIAIAWWRKTIKGSSIADLHRSWAFSTSIKEVVFSLKYFNIVALAALTAKLTIIDGTLMQKALDFNLAVDANPVPVRNISGNAIRTFPETGRVDDGVGDPGILENWTGDTFRMWSETSSSYPLQWTGCESGFCYIKVTGIGFAFECEDRVEVPINYGLELKNAPQDSKDGPTPELFGIKFATEYYNPDLPETNSAHLTMDVTYTQANVSEFQGSCPGTKYTHKCKLWPALVEYPVQIQSIPGAHHVSIGSSHLNVSGEIINTPNDLPFNQTGQQQFNFNVVKRLLLNETETFSAKDRVSQLAGIQLALQMALDAESTLSADENFGEGFNITQTGHAANYMPSPPEKANSCAFYYHNPFEAYTAPNNLFTIPSLIAHINQMMFGLAIDISKDDPNLDPSDHEEWSGKKYPYTVHYRTMFPYMWGAVAATIACVLLVIPVYWGFWELGRKVTLNPFEIAHAFRSPVIGHASTSETDDLMKEVGHHEIRYGPVLSGDGYGRFGVAAPQNVARVSGWRSSFKERWR